MVQLNQILQAIDMIAPWDLAESWDRVGLQIGSSQPHVTKVMVTLDLTRSVIEEGIAKKVNGFVAHHPLIFKPLTQIDTDTPGGHCLKLLIKNDLFLVAAHTNVDKAKQGLNQFLAELFELTEIQTLEPVSSQVYKVVVFTPNSALAKIHEAMAEAGAGVIGDYTDCSFILKGSGTFKPNKHAQPFIGQTAIFNEVEEIRLEMVVGNRSLSRVLKAITENHPYEEPAIDVYPLVSTSGHGLGRIGSLQKPLTLRDLTTLVQSKLSTSGIRVLGDLTKPVQRLAICSGSGGSLLSAVVRKGADVYLTGELGYHDYLTAKEISLAVIEAGHWATEHSFIPLVSNYLKDFFQTEKDLEVLPSSTIQVEPYLTIL